MRSFPTSILICLFILLQSCSQDKDCDVNCTEEYRSIVVQVKYGDGEPVRLDSFKVVELRDGRDITLQLDEQTRDYQRERGIYPIFSDKYDEEYRQQQLQIKFTGYKEGREVVSEIYKVGADCCHVFHLSGDLELEI